MLFKGQVLGKYKILSPLGSGGFGTVYLAKDTWIDKQVAIKVPHRQNLDFGELLREPRLLASVNHPNIVAITPAEKQDGIFFIVMEYVQGDTLENIILREGLLDLTRVLDLTCQICNAVEHAHKQGVLHRDLRPANVLVSETGLAKVADFGTSRFLEIAAHGTTIIGSPPYMAPEQFQGKAVFASDLYSLGITMYQMLTGVLPYDTPSPADLERLYRGDLISPPRLKNQLIPKRINDIIMKALAADIGARYQRAGDLLEDLLAARPLVMKRVTPDQRDTPVGAGAGGGSGGSGAGPGAGGVGGGQGSPAARPADAAELAGIQARLRARETPAPRFCWKCRKALHSRAGRCPFCGEHQ